MTSSPDCVLDVPHTGAAVCWLIADAIAVLVVKHRVHTPPVDHPERQNDGKEHYNTTGQVKIRSVLLFKQIIFNIIKALFLSCTTNVLIMNIKIFCSSKIHLKNPSTYASGNEKLQEIFHHIKTTFHTLFSRSDNRKFSFLPGPFQIGKNCLRQ